MFKWLILLLLWPALLWAGDGQYRSRMALESGEVLPLRQVLLEVEKRFPGQVLEVELEHHHGWVYEIKLLSTDSKLQKIKVDAKTAEVLGIKQKTMKHRGDKHAHPAGRR